MHRVVGPSRRGREQDAHHGSVLEMFGNVCGYECEQGGETVTFPIQLPELQKQLLRPLEIDPPAYA